MALISKQAFKFLDTFGFRIQQEIMLFTRHTYEILWSIIIWYSIKMMYYPTFRQRFAVVFFPYKDMFKDISLMIGSVMFWFHNPNIAIRLLFSATFPIIVRLTPFKAVFKIASFPSHFKSAVSATSWESTTLTELLPAFNTSGGDNSSIIVTAYTYLASRVARFPAFSTWMSMGYNPLIHIPIVTYMLLNSKEGYRP